MNRFEAEWLVNDHTLHSTVSTIKNKLGIPYQGQMETIPGWHRLPTTVMRYWLDDDSRNAIARELMERARKRGSSSSSMLELLVEMKQWVPALAKVRPEDLSDG
ncbi:MAG: hypothetical protein V7752_12650 [Halopseudomonas sp.]